MTQSPLTEPIPLQRHEDGTIRVANTRVSLDILVAAFRAGATAEEIAQDYPSLTLGDIYAVIAYYLRHEDEVGNYLQERGELAEAVRRQNEGRWPSHDLRSRLLARQQR